MHQTPCCDDDVGEIDHAAGIADLVVVPGIDLEQRAVGDHGARRVDDRAARVVGSSRPRPAAASRSRGCRRAGPRAAAANSSLTSASRRRALQLEHAVGQAGVEHRRAHRMAVQLALELGIDQRDRGGAAGRGRLQRQHGRARAAQILVRRIDDDVGVGRIVDGGDLAVADADRLVHHLDHRREAVGGAGGRGQQPVPRGIVEMVVDADDDVERAVVLDRRGDDDALHAAVEIALQLLGLQELAGAFQHDVAAEIAPGDLARRRLRR